jgi:hypothetical protein
MSFTEYSGETALDFVVRHEFPSISGGDPDPRLLNEPGIVCGGPVGATLALSGIRPAAFGQITFVAVAVDLETRQSKLFAYEAGGGIKVAPETRPSCALRGHGAFQGSVAHHHVPPSPLTENSCAAQRAGFDQAFYGLAIDDLRLDANLGHGRSRLLSIDQPMI